MQIKTDKAQIEGTFEEKINQLEVYIENLREEIDFRLSTINQKIESIYEILRNS